MRSVGGLLPFWVFLLYLGDISFGFPDNLTVKYYQDIICEQTTKSSNYVLHTDNSDFFEGLQSTATIDFGTYDFIIIGSGSAGSVVATRLTEIKNWNVLVLEAGTDENDYSTIPAMWLYLENSDRNWGYLSTSQNNSCLSQKDAKCSLYRGKSIGGSSAINGMVYTRGRPEDYDNWAEIGNPGWSFEEVLPYFKKSENSQIDGDRGLHENGGFWNVEYSIPMGPLFKTVVDAVGDLGLPYVEDCNGFSAVGICRTQLSTKKGKRQSTGTAFLANARKRRNLKVVTGALVTKINFDFETKSAMSVEFTADNTMFTANASKEIIVSGGALNTPQLLMLSGIGPREQLESLEIDVVEDLPVGENLIDHVIFSMSFSTNKTAASVNYREAVSQYLDGIGPLSSSADVLGFIHAEDTPNNVPAIEIFTWQATYDFNAACKTGNDDLTNPDETVVIKLGIILLHGESRGSLTLKSNNPIDFPIIDTNYLSVPEDVETFMKGIHFVYNLTLTDTFKRINATIEDVAACEAFKKYSDEYWTCALRQNSSPGLHYIGTTSMGDNKNRSVVDTNLKVHGVKKLRVVDAGVIPSTVSGHINAPVVMIAEKISDAIKAEYA